MQNTAMEKRFFFTIALIYFCNSYHSGQWSRGYRLLCRAKNALKRYDKSEFSIVSNRVLETPIEIMAEPIRRYYAELIKNYADEM